MQLAGVRGQGCLEGILTSEFAPEVPGTDHLAHRNKRMGGSRADRPRKKNGSEFASKILINVHSSTHQLVEK